MPMCQSTISPSSCRVLCLVVSLLLLPLPLLLHLLHSHFLCSFVFSACPSASEHTIVHPAHEHPLTWMYHPTNTLMCDYCGNLQNTERATTMTCTIKQLTSSS